MSIGSQTGANAAITTIDAAISYVQAERSNLGAIQNRLTYTVDNLTNAMTNAASARSRVLDTDYAKETAELARAQIIQQAATAMLAQANQGMIYQQHLNELQQLPGRNRLGSPYQYRH